MNNESGLKAEIVVMKQNILPYGIRDITRLSPCIPSQAEYGK